MPGRRSVLRHGAGRNVDVDVVLARTSPVRAPSSSVCARTQESAACADSCITSPSCPVIVSRPLPGVRRRLDEEDVAADARCTRVPSQRPARTCACALRPRSGAARARPARASRRCVASSRAACPRRPAARPCGSTSASRRSRLRTPASRVYSRMISRSALSVIVTTSPPSPCASICFGTRYRLAMPNFSSSV